MSGEKTEQPTDKRLREARAKGDIAKSTEVVAAATTLAVIAILITNGADFWASLSATMSYILENAATMPYDKAVGLMGATVVACALGIVMPIVGAVLMAALVALLAQTGFLFAPQGAIPKLSNLNPQRWFKQVFSKKNVFDLVKNLLKVLVLAVAVYLAVEQHVREIFMLPTKGAAEMWLVAGALFQDMALYAILAFSAIAALDLVYTKFKYTKDHMMAPDEVKREFKESEGDPHIKQKRKQLHQEMANQATLAKTRKAKVLIVNPTHYAVAIDYDQERTKLPVIVAKGQGDMARRMIAVAQEEHIPIMREAPLARALYAQGQEDQFVPKDLLMAVAAVLKVIATVKDES